MKANTILRILSIGFVVLCVGFIVESGLFSLSANDSKAISLAAEVSDSVEAIDSAAGELDTEPEKISAKPKQSKLDSNAYVLSAKSEKAIIGSNDKESGYELELLVDTLGASVRSVSMTNYVDRETEEKLNLRVLKSVNSNRSKAEKMTFASNNLWLANAKDALPLYLLNWKIGDVVDKGDSQSISFTSVVYDVDDKPAMKLVKEYTVRKGSYMVDCVLRMENVYADAYNVNFDMQGPVGLAVEDYRMDQRKLTSAFLDADGVVSVQKLDFAKVRKNKKEADVLLASDKAGQNLIWAGAGNKYFAAIMRPVPAEGNNIVDGLTISKAVFYDVDAEHEGRADTNENFGFIMGVNDIELNAGSSAEYMFQLYAGPKEKDRFEDNELYNKLGFIHMIDFPMCCGNIFRPLTFFILSVMNGIFWLTGNYGIAVIALVLIVRLAMHPITRKGQISMFKMQKLAPKVEEIKKKYGSDPREMQKQTMLMYRENNVSMFGGMLPMFLQMPIWIALYGAVNSSIDLRCASFLPFWITDLSAPDALITFKAFSLPLLGRLDSFNLLPILLCISMFLQQKLMPTQGKAGSDSKVAQQQKIMMFMMPVMMLMFFYNAPSGLNLYIMTSTFAGVIEQAVIRKHLRDQEVLDTVTYVPTTSKAGGKKKKKKLKPPFGY